MALHIISNEQGKPERGPDGGRKCWSDQDGDAPRDQTVYEKHDTIIGSFTTKVEGERYDPVSGESKAR